MPCSDDRVKRACYDPLCAYWCGWGEGAPLVVFDADRVGWSVSKVLIYDVFAGQDIRQNLFQKSFDLRLTV